MLLYHMDLLHGLKMSGLRQLLTYFVTRASPIRDSVIKCNIRQAVNRL